MDNSISIQRNEKAEQASHSERWELAPDHHRTTVPFATDAWHLPHKGKVGVWLIQVLSTVLSKGSIGLPHGRHSSKKRGKEKTCGQVGLGKGEFNDF